MIQLFGLKFSNYYSLTKALLIEKGLEFEEVKTAPSQEEDFLVKSPMGKMPSISVDGKFLSESIAIFNYLERLQPEPALLPSDPFEAGKVMELVCHLKLDVELVARRCLPEILFKKPVSEETKKEVRRDLAKGIKAVDRLAVCGPYIAGDTLTIADFYAFYCLGPASGMAKVADVDLMDGQDRLAAVVEKMSSHPSIARVQSEVNG